MSGASRGRTAVSAQDIQATYPNTFKVEAYDVALMKQNVSYSILHQNLNGQNRELIYRCKHQSSCSLAKAVQQKTQTEKSGALE